MKKIIIAILTACLVYLPADLDAANDREKARKDRASTACKLISRNEAISRAKSISGGKVVGVKLVRAGKHSLYRVRVLVGEKRIKNVSIKACR